MSNPFEDYYNFLEGYLNALEDGTNKAMAASPMLIRQEFASQARKNLNTSFSEYMAALDIRLKDGILIVELDDSWLAEAVEDGIESFDMHKTILNSKKAKMSKSGFKYMHIPIPVNKTKANASTDKALALQEKIKNALNDPIFYNSKVTKTPEGAFKKMEELVTNDSELKGLYKVQGFKDKASLDANDPSSTQYMMFRTISNNPMSKSQWIHPGIQPKHLFPRVRGWADQTLANIMSDIITDHVSGYLEGK